MLVELRECVFGYRSRPVVRVKELSLRAGRCLGIFGPNGSGKTTLVRGIAGLLPPLAGQVVRGSGGLRFGYLPQHRAMELHWPMSGLDAAALALSARARLGWIDGHLQPLTAALRALDVEKLAHRPFAKLSGGQQQRLLLAGALAADPQVLILDEPTDGLDVHSRQVFLKVLKEAAGRGLSTVMISHDMEELLWLAEEIAWLRMSEEPDEPSHLELLSPAAFAQRLAGVRQLS